MSTIYRQTLKGIDEVAFKSGGLPLRLMSYLLVIDGEASVDQLVARHPNLPSMQVVLQGLCGQGFIEVAGMAANVVDIGQMRVSNGANVSNSAPPQQQAPAYNYAPAPQQASSYSQPVNNGNSSELDLYKSNMIRDVSALLAADAAPVISKIQGCRTRDDLFSTMMGIKKIITIYTNREAADKFVARYSALSS
jgi:hypothetical protein